MSVSGYLKTALLVTATLLPFLGQVESTSSSSSVVFSTCVDNCIGYGACGLSAPGCMCRASRGSFLDNVLVCMYHHCTRELPDADALFLEPMERGCASIDRPIPEDDIDDAERVLSVLVSKLSKATSTLEAYPTSTPTRQQSKTTESKPEPTETSSTLSSSVGRGDLTSTTTDKPASTTSARTADSATRASSQSSTETKPAPNTDPTDSSPFATPRGAAMRSMGSYLWAGLPLVIAVALR